MYLTRRQFNHDGEGIAHDNMGVWYSPTAYVVKWAVLLSLFLTFFLWITIGYYHARKRIKRGQAPLAYHRWLVPRSKRSPRPSRQQQQQNTYAYYHQPHYRVHDSSDPPPAYSNSDLPPTYQPYPMKQIEVHSTRGLTHQLTTNDAGIQNFDRIHRTA